MGKERKKFGDTKFGGFLKAAVKSVPDLAEVAIEAVTNPVSAVKLAKSKLEEKAEQDQQARELLLELQMEQMEMEKELKELQYSDRNSARQMQIAALNQKDVFAKRYIYILATFIILATITYGILLLFVEVPEKNSHLVQEFGTGLLYAGLATITGFFFGGAHTDKAKKISE